MRLKIDKKTIKIIIISTGVISALLYNFLYTNNKKNEIINEVEAEYIEEEIVETKTIFVDISGEVNIPGLYELNEGARLNDVVNLAGGLTVDADIDSINLAYILSDAIKVIIPKREEKEQADKNNEKKVAVVNNGMFVSENKTTVESNVINLNTATKEQLKQLDGIGESTAQKIIDYRNENGNFTKIDELKNVSGIGSNKFEKIKGKLIV